MNPISLLAVLTTFVQWWLGFRSFVSTSKVPRYLSTLHRPSRLFIEYGYMVIWLFIAAIDVQDFASVHAVIHLPFVSPGDL